MGLPKLKVPKLKFIAKDAPLGTLARDKVIGTEVGKKIVWGDEQKKIAGYPIGIFARESLPYIGIPAAVGGLAGASYKPNIRKRDLTWKKRLQYILTGAGIGALAGSPVGIPRGLEAAGRMAKATPTAQKAYKKSWQAYAKGSPPKAPAKPVGAPAVSSGQKQPIFQMTEKLLDDVEMFEAVTHYGLPISKPKTEGITKLKTQYRKAMLKAHPDRGGNPEIARGVNAWKDAMEDSYKIKISSLFEDSFFDELVHIST